MTDRATCLQALFNAIACAACVGATLVGCSKQDSMERSAMPSANEEHSAMMLKAEPLLADPAIGIISRLTLSHGRLWIVDFGQEPFFHIVDTTTWHIVASRGRRGSGPGDFRSLRNIFRVRGASTDVWAYDGVRYRLQRLSENGIPELTKSVEFGPKRNLIGVAPLGDRWIGWSAALDSTRRYLGFDARGGLLFTAAGPFLGDSTESPLQRQHASVNHVLCARPAGDRFAVLYGYAGRIELRGRQAELIALAQVPDPSNGDFVTTRRGDRVWAGRTYHYQACAATDDHLFALFSGNAAVDPKTGEVIRGAGNSTTIQVFDWTGRFMTALAVDPALRAIGISEDGQWLYGGGADSSVVFRFHLPPIPNAPRP